MIQMHVVQGTSNPGNLILIIKREIHLYANMIYIEHFLKIKWFWTLSIQNVPHKPCIRLYWDLHKRSWTCILVWCDSRDSYNFMIRIMSNNTSDITVR